MATNRVVRAPIRVILCAQKAMCLGYMLARPGPQGHPETAQTRVEQISRTPLPTKLLRQFFGPGAKILPNNFRWSHPKFSLTKLFCFGVFPRLLTKYFSEVSKNTNDEMLPAQ